MVRAVAMHFAETTALLTEQAQRFEFEALGLNQYAPQISHSRLETIQQNEAWRRMLAFSTKEILRKKNKGWGRTITLLEGVL